MMVIGLQIVYSHHDVISVQHTNEFTKKSTTELMLFCHTVLGIPHSGMRLNELSQSLCNRLRGYVLLWNTTGQ